MPGKINRPVLLLLALILSYAPVLLTNHPVNPDAQFIIPNLTEVSGINEYIQNLFSLKTIDVQPVRDLTFTADILIFKLTGWNSFIWINLLLFWLSGFLLYRILNFIFRDLSENQLWMIIACFLLYPLFSQTVAWGMARKHLLAFVFILAATDAWLRKKRFSTIFYGLSVFSQPITLLWPCWAAVQNPKNWKKLIPSFLLMILTVAVNFIYYRHSEVFRSIYGTKINELAAVPEKTLALGHYVFQLIFPYLLSNRYGLGHWSTLAGLGLIVLLFLYFRKRVEKERFLSWGLFLVFPILIVIAQASSLYDTYLLAPGVAFLILILASLKIPFSTRVLIIPVLIWGSLTFYEAFKWRDEVTLTERSFSRRPDCLSAFQHARSSYEEGRLPSRDSLAYLRDYDCRDLPVSVQHRINLDASIALYENYGTIDERIEKLKGLNIHGIYPGFALVSLYIKTGRKDDAKTKLAELHRQWAGLRFRNEFIPMTAEIIEPFCRKEADRDCLELIKPFIKKNDGLSYR